MMKKKIALLLLSSVMVNAFAQHNNPKGLYQLKEIVHNDGKVVAPPFVQYKYCNDQVTLQINHNFVNWWEKGGITFNMQNVDGNPLTYTGELSATENKGIQIFNNSNDSLSFVLRWYNANMQNNVNFPFQTNIDEIYHAVTDKHDDILQAVDMLNMKLGEKKNKLQGVWRLRGVQTEGRTNSQYWIDKINRNPYRIYSDSYILNVYANKDFPAQSINCQIVSYDYLSENAYEEEGAVNIVTWFDSETMSTTCADENGQTHVLVWDRCGLPLNMQNIFGTDVPQLTKDITPYYNLGFELMYGQKPDSIKQAFEAYDYLVNINEQNNAIVSMLRQNGFEEEYSAMKQGLLDKLVGGEIGIEEAVSKYVFWFYKDFDKHTNISTGMFHKMQHECDIDYLKVMKEYAPKPMACKIDDDTYFVRIPSCSGNYPTYKWVEEKVAEYKASGCQYLILDVRGNNGGNDGLGSPFYELLGDCSGKKDLKHVIRNGLLNVKSLEFSIKKSKRTGDNFDLAEKAIDAINEQPNSEYAEWFTMPIGKHTFTPQVKKGAVIMDGHTASAGESFIMFAKNFSKTHAKVYGKDNSWGAEKTGNINTVKLPNCDIYFTYPTTVNIDFAEVCKQRKTGYSPDVIIPIPYPEKLTDNIDEWVLWVAKDLKKRKF